MVVALTKINKVGYRDLDELKDQLKQEVMNDKKFDKLAQQLAGVKDIAAAKAKGAVIDTVKQVTFAAPVFVQAAAASEPALSGAVAALKKGAVSPVVKGNGAAYIFQVLDKKSREGAKYDAKQQSTQLSQMAAQAASRFIGEMYQKANVVDNRYLFF
jgi:peptidyl-prolyl cis-trans isomerase D